MRPIDADATWQYKFLDPNNEYRRGWNDALSIVASTAHCPTVEHYGNVDISANAVFDIATREDYLRFREMDEMCPVCQRDLEVYYCENRTYVVRCKHCHIVTLVSAGNPYEAAAKVGLHVKPVRHGRWKSMDEYCNHSKTFRCSVCKRDVEYSYFTRFCEYDYCPNCGAKMDLEVQDD